MVEVYGKLGRSKYAAKVFDEMPERDLVNWTSMISAYVSEGDINNAFKLFNKMRVTMEPNSVTVIVLLRGCSASGSSIQGRQMHSFVIRNGTLFDESVRNSVLEMYTKMEEDEEIENLFGEIHHRDIVSWNTLMSYYSHRGYTELGEVDVSKETLTLVISASAKLQSLLLGEHMHRFFIKLGLQDDTLRISLLDFYAKCGKLENSTLLFREVPCGNDYFL